MRITTFRLLCASWIFIFSLVTTVYSQQTPPAEEQIEIPVREGGIFFERDDGTFVNVNIEGDKWVVYFTNELKQIMAPDYDKVSIRFENLSRSKADGVVAVERAAGQVYLTSPRYVAPPYRYYVSVTLLHPTDNEQNKFLGREFLDAVGQ